MIDEDTKDIYLEPILYYEETKNTVEKIIKSSDLVGIKNLLKWLKEESDYFFCPASSGNKHGTKFGGLLQHSYNVYENLLSLNIRKNLGLTKNNLIVMGLFHDVCKANSYTLEDRWIKEGGQWVLKKIVSYSDDFPCGHGEKSVIILQRFISLTEMEIMAIRWHMGWIDTGVHGYPSRYSFNAALKKHKEITALMVADMEAAGIDEREG